MKGEVNIKRESGNRETKRKTDCYIGSNPSINVRLNLFTFKEVNLVLEHPPSTNFIVWAF